MTTVKTIAPHDNEYGDAPEKKKGDVYDAPDQVAQGLIANGYAKAVTPPKTSR